MNAKIPAPSTTVSQNLARTLIHFQPRMPPKAVCLQLDPQFPVLLGGTECWEAEATEAVEALRRALEKVNRTLVVHPSFPATIKSAAVRATCSKALNSVFLYPPKQQSQLT